MDRKGLAQHYELPTDLIDVTSNFDVATFFAVCRRDSHTKAYLPVRSASKPGVLYRIIPAALMDGLFFNGKEDDIFSHVGWQPLHRPEQQRACGVRLTKGQDFCRMPSVQMVLFRHSAEISERIWYSFAQGRALFPADPAADPAAELAKQALKLNGFSKDQLDLAWTRLESWKGRRYDTKKRKHMEKQEKIQLKNNPVLSWDGLGVEHDEQKLKEKLNGILGQVHFRRVMWPK